MEDKKPFIVILDWMYDLGLTSSEVLAVAIINGYTQDGTHTCHVSLSYFERRCCLSKQGVIDLLKRLEAKGVIKAERQSGRATEYTLNVSEEGVKKLDGSRNLTGQETTQKGSSFFTPLSFPHTPYYILFLYSLYIYKYIYIAFIRARTHARTRGTVQKPQYTCS